MKYFPVGIGKNKSTVAVNSNEIFEQRRVSLSFTLVFEFPSNFQWLCIMQLQLAQIILSAGSDIGRTRCIFSSALNTEHDDVRGTNNMRQSCNGRMPDWANIILEEFGNNCPQNAIMHRSIIPLVTQPNCHHICSEIIPFHVVNGMLLFHLCGLWPYLIIWCFFYPPHCRNTPGSWITCTPFPSPPHMTALFFFLLIKLLHMCAPFWLEIGECTVAPVAMEDSDHEVNSSSEEQDSCPASPNHSRTHEAEQVLLTPSRSP